MDFCAQKIIRHSICGQRGAEKLGLFGNRKMPTGVLAGVGGMAFIHGLLCDNDVDLPVSYSLRRLQGG